MVLLLCWNYFFLRAGKKPDKRTAVKLGSYWMLLQHRDASVHFTPYSFTNYYQGLSTSSQAPSLGVQDTGVDATSPLPSVPVLIASGAPSTSSSSPRPAELRKSFCSTMVHVDRLNESSHQETELNSTTALKSLENTEKDLNRSRTVVNESCLMELFKRSDLQNDLDNVTGTAELSAPGADDSCDKEVYISEILQMSQMSELLLECDEEELEPWQKQTSQVHWKDEDDVGEMSIDQTDCKLDPESLQMTTTPPKLKAESPQPVLFNSQGFIVASPQLTSNTEFIGSPVNSLPIVTAGQQQLFCKVSPAAVTPEAHGVVQTSEEQQIRNNPLSLSSV
ncbi:uncharacterized protein LOC121907198 isoform X4 [Scomber scombrus]|uniref:Uncharacterized protein LOC121907198 isoform X4 n=1 Tax=Scomber scombrus TaxID=13677 RepID=A0AAV1N5R7_SCOSC